MEWRFKSQVSLQHFTTTMTNYSSFWIFTSFNVVVFLMSMRREKVNEDRYIENILVTKCEPSILKSCEICLECLQAFEIYLLRNIWSYFSTKALYISYILTISNTWNYLLYYFCFKFTYNISILKVILGTKIIVLFVLR